GAVEVLQQPRAPALVGGPPRERVLHYGHLGLGVPQAAAQLSDLAHGQPAVVRADDRVDRLQARAHLGDGRGLLFAIQSRHLLVWAAGACRRIVHARRLGRGRGRDAPERLLPDLAWVARGPVSGAALPGGRPHGSSVGSPDGYRSAPTSSSRFVVRVVSTGTPGPIVSAIVMERRYRPFAAAGFARMISSSTTW